MIGQTLAHYKILEKIGSGGMGDVYLAEDTKLDRKVALKVLPPELAESEERRARFQREAKALAALDHPNIVTVHSVEEADGTHFITMELVKGKTLAELLPKNGFPLDKFLEIAMRDAFLMRRGDGIGQGNRDVEEPIQRKAVLGQKLRQRLAVNELHGDEVDAFGLLDGVDCDDVGVVERGDGFSFSLEPSPALLALG